MKIFGNAPHCIDHFFSGWTIGPVGPLLLLLVEDKL